MATNNNIRKTHPAERYFPRLETESSGEYSNRLQQSNRKSMYERAGMTHDEDLAKKLDRVRQSRPLK